MANPRKAGVIGWPVAHSLSPKLHRYWLDKYHIAGEYAAVAVAPEALAKTVPLLVKQGFCGFNVTVPHKETILPFLDAIDDTARTIGAVNTVVIKKGRLTGSNTDAYGFAESLRQSMAVKSKGKAVVLGAGGAAKAAVKGLVDEKFSRIVLVCRTPEKGFIIHNSPIGKNRDMVIEPWTHRNEALADADLLVNATSLGMQGKEALDLDLALLPPAATVVDLVYTPLKTPLLTQARARGNAAIDGLGMLMYQAAPGFASWFGVTPQVDKDVREYLLHG